MQASEDDMFSIKPQLRMPVSRDKYIARILKGMLCETCVPGKTEIQMMRNNVAQQTQASQDDMFISAPASSVSIIYEKWCRYDVLNDLKYLCS